MVLASDRPAGSTAECEPVSGAYTAGDPALAPFTACDLTCNHLHKQSISAPEDTYKGCEFPQMEWAVAQTSNAAEYLAKRAIVVDNMLIIAGAAGSTAATEQDLTIMGPFSADDPGGAAVAVLQDDLTLYDG